ELRGERPEADTADDERAGEGTPPGFVEAGDPGETVADVVPQWRMRDRPIFRNCPVPGVEIELQQPSQPRPLALGEGGRRGGAQGAEPK
ncbi:MAG: hypothetical protein JSW65_03520, partial [Candidatus Bipolaricaulota bacterium]